MLETTIDAESTADAVTFRIRVRNRGDEAAELSFSDGQRVRVSVYKAGEQHGGEPQWRSDEDQMFMQVLGSETVPPHGETVFSEVWTDPQPGDYRAVGEVVCHGRELRAETTLSVYSRSSS